MDKPIVVVLGKASYRKSEQHALETFGQALAHRSKQLLTTQSPPASAAHAVRIGYEFANGRTQFLKPGDLEPFDGRYPVVVFTDKRMQDQLDERMPNWRTRGWIVIHNIKETEEAGRKTREVLAQLGTPLPDGG